MLATHSYDDETIYSLSNKAPQRPERRSDPRQLTVFRVGVLVVGSLRELCVIRNVSAGGLMVQAYSRFTTGQRLAVELQAEHPTTGTVVWIDGPNIGIGFDAPIDVEEMLSSQSVRDKEWRSRPPRIEVDWLGTLRVGAITYGVSTRDISQSGIKLEIDGVVEADREVVLTLEKFRALPGMIRWYRDGACGVSFNQVIPFRELMDWLRG